MLQPVPSLLRTSLRHCRYVRTGHDAKRPHRGRSYRSMGRLMLTARATQCVGARRCARADLSRSQTTSDFRVLVTGSGGAVCKCGYPAGRAGTGAVRGSIVGVSTRANPVKGQVVPASSVHTPLGSPPPFLYALGSTFCCETTPTSNQHGTLLLAVSG